MDRIKIGIVDDSELAREMVKVFLRRSDDPLFKIVFELESCENIASTELFSLAPQVIILDLDMPGTNGLEAIPLFLNYFPDCRIIMFSGTKDKATVLRCIQAGAKGYLDKSTRKDEFIHTIKTIIEAGMYIKQSIEKLVVEVDVI